MMRGVSLPRYPTGKRSGQGAVPGIPRNFFKCLVQNGLFFFKILWCLGKIQGAWALPSAMHPKYATAYIGLCRERSCYVIVRAYMHIVVGLCEDLRRSPSFMSYIFRFEHPSPIKLKPSVACYSRSPFFPFPYFQLPYSPTLT